MNNLVVGEDIILPRSLRLQNALPSVVFFIVGTDVLGGPSSLRSQNELPSVAQKARFTEAFPCEGACREATVEFASKRRGDRLRGMSRV